MACREDAYVFNDTCRSCDPGWAPDSTKTRCVKLAAEVIAWDSPWAIVPLVFASIGILSTLFTLAIFIRSVFASQTIFLLFHFFFFSRIFLTFLSSHFLELFASYLFLSYSYNTHSLASTHPVSKNLIARASKN